MRVCLDPPATHAPSAPAQSVSARVACIEAKESRGLNVPNARGSGAGGVMQYMPSTFARGAREMGHPEWNLWNPEQARAVAATTWRSAADLNGALEVERA